jgi:hypothetical protein
MLCFDLIAAKGSMRITLWRVNADAVFNPDD